MDLYNTLKPGDNDMTTMIGRGKTSRMVDMTGRSVSASGEDSTFRPRAGADKLSAVGTGAREASSPPVRLSGMVVTPAQTRQQERGHMRELPPPYTNINGQPPMNPAQKPLIVSRMAESIRAASSSGKKGLSTWALVGIIVGSIIGAVLLVAAIVHYTGNTERVKSYMGLSEPTLSAGGSAAQHYAEVLRGGFI